MKDKFDSNIELDDMLDRLRFYYSKFNIANQSYLLTELYTSTVLLKAMLSKTSSSKKLSKTKKDENKVVELNQRLDKINEDLNGLSDKLTTVQKDFIDYDKKVDQITDDHINTLYAIEKVEKENNKQFNRLDILEEETENELEIAEEKRASQRTTFDNQVSRRNTRISNLETEVDAIDTDSIKADLAILEKEDETIAKLINSSHIDIKSKTDEVSERNAAIDISEHIDEIHKLESEDTALTNLLTETVNTSNADLDEIVTANELIASDLKALDDSTVGLENKLLIGSNTPVANKVPIGQANGQIDSDWFAND